MTQTETGSYDLVILGGGSGGYACALRAAELGHAGSADREGQGRRHVPAPRLHPDQGAAARGRDRRPRAGTPPRSACWTTFDGIDMPAVNIYKDKVVDRLWKGLQGTLASRKVEMVYGDGRLVSPTAVAVGDVVY